MAKLPDVYQIYQKDGQAVVFDGDECMLDHTEATWVLKDKIYAFYNDFYDHHTDYEAFKVDDEIVRSVANNFRKGIFKLGEYEYLYPYETMAPIINALKDEKDSLIRLSEALKPTTDLKERNLKVMSEKKEKKEVAVRFYEGYISNEKISFKRGDKTIPMKRVKMPNDDPDDSTPRRSFIVNEAAIGTDTKNSHMKFVYLGEESEYRVVRKNFDPETKQSEILEDFKMTGKEISDVFTKERDREYAEYKASQAQDNSNETEIDAPEEVIENEEGIEISQ